MEIKLIIMLEGQKDMFHGLKKTKPVSVLTSQAEIDKFVANGKAAIAFIDSEKSAGFL